MLSALLIIFNFSCVFAEGGIPSSAENETAATEGEEGASDTAEEQPSAGAESDDPADDGEGAPADAEDPSNDDSGEDVTEEEPSDEPGPVTYVDEKNNAHTITEYEELTGSTSELTLGKSGTESWYVLKGSIRFDETVFLKGTVNLVLREDCDAYFDKSIIVEDPDKAIFWGEQLKSGKIDRQYRSELSVAVEVRQRGLGRHQPAGLQHGHALVHR